MREIVESAATMLARSPAIEAAVQEGIGALPALVNRTVRFWNNSIVAEIGGTAESKSSSCVYGLPYRAIANSEEMGLPNLQEKLPAIVNITREIPMFGGRTMPSHGNSFHLGDGKFGTAFHVVADETGVLRRGSRLVSADGKTSDFQVIAADPTHDFATIRATEPTFSRLPVIDFSNKKVINNQQIVFALARDPRSDVLEVAMGKSVEPFNPIPQVAFYKDAQRFEARTFNGMSGGPIMTLDSQGNYRAISIVSKSDSTHTWGPPQTAMTALRNESWTQSVLESRIEKSLKRERASDRYRSHPDEAYLDWRANILRRARERAS